MDRKNWYCRKLCSEEFRRGLWESNFLSLNLCLKLEPDPEVSIEVGYCENFHSNRKYRNIRKFDYYHLCVIITLIIGTLIKSYDSPSSHNIHLNWYYRDDVFFVVDKKIELIDYD